MRASAGSRPRPNPLASPHALVIGGQRSGKSRVAEGMIAATGLASVYVATASAGDGEMAERIARHRARRGGSWRTIEEPLELAQVLVRQAGEDTAVLVDCLTLWLSNLMSAGRSPQVEADRLTGALDQAPGPVVLVTSEVGAGIIPADEMSRRYADELGTLNQAIAAVVGQVILVAAGQPLILKPSRQIEAP